MGLKKECENEKSLTEQVLAPLTYLLFLPIIENESKRLTRRESQKVALYLCELFRGKSALFIKWE